MVGTAVPNNNQERTKDVEESKKAYVIQGVKVWNVNTEGKARTTRTRSEVSNEPVSSKAKRRTTGVGVAGPSRAADGDDVQMVIDKPARKKRAPPRKLEVNMGELDIWSVLKATDSGTSLAQLIATNKKVAGDIQAGIRFMHGRKRKSLKAVDGGKRPQVYRATVKCVEDSETGDSEGDVDDDSDDGDSYLYPSGYSSCDEFSEVESEVEGSLSGYESEDTHYEYAYNVNRLKEASPFMVNVKVGKVEVEAVVDTGAATSVISKGLARKLGLRVNGDLMTIEQLDGNPSKPNGVCEQVQMRIGGKLRPEHFIVHDNKDDLMLLGMTWFEAYGAVPHPQDRQLLIPTRSGRDVMVQGRSMNDEERKVYTVGSIGIYHAKIGSVSQRVYDGEDEAYDEKVKEEVLPEEVQSVLDEYEDKVFVETAGLGKVQGFEHKIVTTEDTPITSKPYRMTWQEDKFLKETLDDLLDKGLIRRSDGEWTAPVIFVSKKTGELRVCQDYRKLNRITVKDGYPLPHVDDLIDSVGGSSWFSTLDAANGFWQIPMAEDSVSKTGFTTKYGTFVFLTMPFGLTSAPATFQRVMTTILQDYIGDFVYVFIDDIIIFSKTQQDHANHLRLVFEACMKYNLRLKKKKCYFCRQEVEYLGHTISINGILPNGRNTEKVQNMPKPRNAKDIRSFLGMTGYYRRFVQDYASMAEPLTKMTRKDQQFIWGAEQQQTFEAFKSYLLNPPLLSFPDKSQVQILTSDASGKGIAAILSQSPDGTKEEETVIAYASRTLKPAESRYSTTHLEALAIIWGVHHFRHYLAGRFFVLNTDHAALKYILNNPKPGAKLARWSAALMEYEFEVRYRQGSQNPADALSRLVEEGDDIDSLEVCVDDDE